MFQSHNGAIAAPAGGRGGGEINRSFNPTMVRLLLMTKTWIWRVGWCFNPTMVRLLLKPRPCAAFPNGGFNPTMVRLLPLPLISAGYPHISFQSHNGAIAATGVITQTKSLKPVSIPQWCDCCQRPTAESLSLGSCFNPTMVRLLQTRPHHLPC